MLNFYGLYLIKERKKMGWMLGLSIILDTALCIVGLMMLALIPTTQKDSFCSKPDVTTYFAIVGSVLVVRVLHVIIMIIYLVLVAFGICFCPDSCFVRGILFRKKGVS